MSRESIKPYRGLSGLERVKRTAKLLRANVARLSLRPDNRVGAVIDYSEGPYPFHFRQLIVTATPGELPRQPMVTAPPRAGTW